MDRPVLALLEPARIEALTAPFVIPSKTRGHRVRARREAGSSGIAPLHTAMPTIHTTQRFRRWLHRAAAIALLACTTAHAAPVAVPDAQDWARLTPAERRARKADIRSQLDQASPAERKMFRQQLRRQIEDLTPQQRQALINQTRQGWQSMSPDEQRRLTDERRAQIQAMSPAERRELLRQRREMLHKLSPEERAALRDRLPAR